MKAGWALLGGIILNLLFAILLFESRSFLTGVPFAVAFLLVMGFSAWVATRISVDHREIAGIGSVVPLISYLTYVNLIFFHKFGLAELATVTIILGSALVGTYLALRG